MLYFVGGMFILVISPHVGVCWVLLLDYPAYSDIALNHLLTSAKFFIFPAEGVPKVYYPMTKYDKIIHGGNWQIVRNL